MKRFGGLWSRVVSFENLHRAAYQVLRGKRSKEQAGDFFYDLEGNLLCLQRELAGGTYIPGDYRTFWISDPKPRLISAAPFRDRVVHHALVNIIEPLFEMRFIDHSYACRKGKGTHRALAQFDHWAHTTKYILKMDIRKFFPSLDHEILKQKIARTVKDREVLGLCRLIIDQSNQQERVIQYFPGDTLLTPLERRIGIPIGNLTSQFLANVYLDGLDHFVKDGLRVRRYLRYVDDFCCFADDKQDLRWIRDEIVDHLETIRLRLNDGKSRIRQLKEGVEFLGFVFFDNTTRLNQRGVKRQRARVKLLQRDYADERLSWEDVKASLQAWDAHAAHGRTWRLRSRVFESAVFQRNQPAGIGG